MNEKKGGIVGILSIVSIFLFIILLSLIFYFYVLQSEKLENIGDVSENNVNNISEGISQLATGSCEGEDSYILPDFNRMREILKENQMIKDVPSNGKIKLMFYHFVGDCRKWDKAYFLSGGEIGELGDRADIDIWISSNYAGSINQNNLCEVISSARANGDLGQAVNIGNTKLMLVYGKMLKYKSCLGL